MRTVAPGLLWQLSVGENNLYALYIKIQLHAKWSTLQKYTEYFQMPWRIRNLPECSETARTVLYFDGLSRTAGPEAGLCHRWRLGMNLRTQGPVVRGRRWWRTRCPRLNVAHLLTYLSSVAEVKATVEKTGYWGAVCRLVVRLLQSFSHIHVCVKHLSFR